jgi:hypothetical protein
MMNKVKQSSENFNEVINDKATRQDLLNEYAILGTPDEIRRVCYLCGEKINECEEERELVIALEELLTKILDNFELDAETRKCIRDKCDIPKQAEEIAEKQNEYKCPKHKDKPLVIFAGGYYGWCNVCQEIHPIKKEGSK